MDPLSGSGASAVWAYQRWTATDPDVTISGRVTSADALRSSPPGLLHRVDTWEPGSVQSDWNSWYDSSAWSTTATSSTDPQSASALLAPAQQFIVSPATARLAAMSPDAVTSAVLDAVSAQVGVPASDLAARLRAGQSLSGVAADANTSHGDLVNAIRSALPDLHDPILQTTAAEQLAATAGPLDPASLQLPATAGGDETQVLAISLYATSTLLSTTPGDLMRQLSQGASLTGIASSLGVAHADLITAVRSDLPPQTPGWADGAALAEAIAGDTTSTTETPLPTAAGQRFTVDPGSGPQNLTLSLDATASLLSTTATGLMQQLSQGASLNGIADSLGVSQDDLVSALATDLPAQTPGWADVTVLAGQLAGATDSVTVTPRSATGQQFTVDPGSGVQYLTVSLDATASLLSTTPADLMRQLSQGSSLSGIADGLGVSHDDLVSALATDLPAQTPGWADITTLADRLAGATGSVTVGARATASQQFTVDPGSGPQNLSLSLDTTASVLSTTPAQLAQQLAQGASLSSIAGSLGVAHDDLLNALITDLPAQTPGWADVVALAEQLAGSTTSTST